MPLPHINHVAWLLVTARLATVYIGAAAEASRTLASLRYSDGAWAQRARGAQM